ncbi:3-hydroxybutyryl-CoA dehydratase [beta proteobacterium AAP121]|nr:3-hydroxybutyryl-CoA dehydratase [beta proteobacterium AAP65]KPG00346.1 3-hydroxybutyryl-CoA dehydratase [beta proteobacterium AAP121]
MGPPLLHLAGNGLATITLQRPQHHHRLHREDLHTLQQHLHTLSAEPLARALVITASGPVFCSGFHLGELEAAETGAADPQLFEHTVDALEALPLPTVARLNGSVYGGATDLALACDFRLGVQGMELRMPAARLGLHYYPSGLQRYVSRLGLQTAKRLFLLAQAVPAEELLRFGYLDQLVPADALDAATDATVQALLAGAPLALQGMKLSLNDTARGPDAAASARIAERVAQCANSADLQEGLAAWAGRRSARFSGR